MISENYRGTFLLKILGVTYLLFIVLIGVVIYYVIKWSSADKSGTTSNQTNDKGNPYKNQNREDNRDTGPYSNNSSGYGRRSGSPNYASWIGGGLGWAFGGPIGGILGFMFGSMMGGATSMQRGSTGQTRVGDFNVSLLILSAAVMKADGKVTRNELDYVKQFIARNFGADRAPQYVIILGDLIKQDYNLQEVSMQIRQYMDYSSKLMLLQFLFGIAMADGKTPGNEISLIENIAGYMGISNNDYLSVKAMFIKDTNSAYNILEVSPDASNDEIKKAYRELAKKYHPDKVSHLGDDVKKAAEVKISELNAAYDAIKQERGMN